MIKRKVEGKTLHFTETNNVADEIAASRFPPVVVLERLFDEKPDSAVTEKLLSRRFFD